MSECEQLKNGSRWRLDVYDRASGSLLTSFQHLSKKLGKELLFKAMSGELDSPQYPWQLEFRLTWDSWRCPAGHDVDEHPRRTRKQVDDDWAKRFADLARDLALDQAGSTRPAKRTYSAPFEGQE